MNFTNKLQVIYRTILDNYVDDKFIIKLSSEEISLASLYKVLDSYTKNDITTIMNNIQNIEGAGILIDGDLFNFDDFDGLLAKSIPNLDEAFKLKMINNFQLIENTVNALHYIDSLSTEKINAYLDNHYKKNLNLDFLKQFNNVDAPTLAQLALLKKDQTNDAMIQEIMTDFYPMFIEIKTQELIANTLSVKELILFKAD